MKIGEPARPPLVRDSTGERRIITQGKFRPDGEIRENILNLTNSIPPPRFGLFETRNSALRARSVDFTLIPALAMVIAAEGRHWLCRDLPAEMQMQGFASDGGRMVDPSGLEPETYRLKVRCSTN